MTQGKIDRWHRSLKNQVLMENHYFPGDLKASVDEFLKYYNNERYHQSLDNLTSEDVYAGRGQAVPDRRKRIEQKIIKERRSLYCRQKTA
jgi:putative transposase